MIDCHNFLENCRIFIDFYLNNELSEKEETKILIKEVFKMIKSLPKEAVGTFIGCLSLSINYLLYKNELNLVFELVCFLENEILFQNFLLFLQNFNYPELAKLVENKMTVNFYAKPFY